MHKGEQQLDAFLKASRFYNIFDSFPKHFGEIFKSHWTRTFPLDVHSASGSEDHSTQSTKG